MFKIHIVLYKCITKTTKKDMTLNYNLFLLNKYSDALKQIKYNNNKKKTEKAIIVYIFSDCKYMTMVYMKCLVTSV